MIEIYGTETCSYCLKAKRLVESYKLQYKYLDISVDENRNEMFRLNPGTKTIPQIWVDEHYIGGYSELEIYLKNTIGDYGDQPI